MAARKTSFPHSAPYCGLGPARRGARTGLIRRLGLIFKALYVAKSGATVVMVALMLPVLIGFLGLGAETGYFFYLERNLQNIADAAAGAGAVVVRQNGSNSAAEAAAEDVAGDSGLDLATSTLTITSPGPFSIPGGGSRACARAEVSRVLPRLFSRIFLNDDVTLSVDATAVVSQCGRACILALDPSAANAIDFRSTADITLTGCDVHSNSVDPASVLVAGSAQVEVGCIAGAGGVVASSGLTTTECSQPIEGANAIDDPYDGLPTPAPGPCSPA